MNTKRVTIVGIQEDELVREAAVLRQKRIDGAIDSLNEDLQAVLQYMYLKVSEQSWIPMEGGVFFEPSVMSVFPDPAVYPIGHCSISRPYEPASFQGRFGPYEGQLMTPQELKLAFGKNPAFCQEYLGVPAEEVCFTCGDPPLPYSLLTGESKRWKSFSKGESYHVPISRLCTNNSSVYTNMQILFLWLTYRLIPRELSPQLSKAFQRLCELMKCNREYYTYGDNHIELNREKIKEDAMEGKFQLLQENGQEPVPEQSALPREPEAAPRTLSEEGRKALIARLLDCDKVRCDIEKYDEKILSDPNRGHWDLWDEPDTSALYTVKLADGLIARSPAADIKYDGVVGIDFGTKSTVVVYQENTEHVLPMRIGTGHISERVESKHYENPTVMELLDLERFMTRYLACEGRPDTRWEDLMISHTANDSMLASTSEEYYSFFNELKQWAGDRRRQIRLKDKKGKDILLPSFLDIPQGDFNPIEIYAYYIGLYINNMHNGIYLDYFLSFPVTYENAVRTKILESFERGLKKSLPVSVLENESIMERFRVSSTISEPAAYAICALEQSYPDLDEQEKIYYGIFDFGGGTTDFDYGIWRESDPAERKYDYVLECFGAGGDQYLGGESLLELLAFEVFTENQDVLRDARISFVLPPECKRFPGCEMLLSESQEAKLNSRQLMEVLRPYWEQREGYLEAFQNDVIQLSLFNKEGQEQKDFSLKISAERINEILKERIGKGIRNFFEGLRAAFFQDAREEIEQIDIFLAGNSSRSSLVMDLFDEYTALYAKDLAGQGKTLSFQVHRPLGFDVPSEDRDFSFITRPNGKTGVAFGLIEGRPGGRIKLVLPDLPKNMDGRDTEIKFKYFIGYKKKNCFRIISDRDVPYGNWIELYDASQQDFTIYYTSLPEALTGQMSILDVSKKNCRLAKTYRDASIYYRPVAPTVIEYVVAKADELAGGEYLEDIVQIELT